MNELSVLSISLSIASLGIFFLFFMSNDDEMLINPKNWELI